MRLATESARSARQRIAHDGATVARFGYARGLKSLQRTIGAALLVTMMAWPWAANAAIDTLVSLEYQADEQGGCVGEDELRRMVTHQLGHDPFSPDADQRVAVSIAKTDAGYKGRIVWTDAGGRSVGERLLSSRSRDCGEIAANLAFTVALQLQLVERGASKDAGAADPNAARPPPKVTDQSDRPPVTPERTTPATESPRVPGQESPARPVLAVGAGPAVGVGMAPDTTAFGRLFVVARFRRLSAELAADAALPVTLREPDGTGAVVNAMGLTAAGCAHVSVMSACALGRLGWIRAHGVAIAAPKASWGWFNELGVRLAASRDFGRFSVGVHADGLVMLSRWNVVLNDAVVWSVPRLGGVLGLDVALRFF